MVKPTAMALPDGHGHGHGQGILGVSPVITLNIRPRRWPSGRA